MIQTNRYLVEYRLNYRNNVWGSRFRDEENTLNPRRVSSPANMRDKKLIVIKYEIRYDRGKHRAL